MHNIFIYISNYSVSTPEVDLLIRVLLLLQVCDDQIRSIGDTWWDIENVSYRSVNIY